jgi:hypothetical protein
MDINIEQVSDIPTSLDLHKSTCIIISERFHNKDTW